MRLEISIQNLDIYVLIFAAIFLFFCFCYFIIFLLLRYRKKQKKNALEKQLLKSQFNQTLLQSQLEIQEQTLNKISQEIHNNIGQVLSLAKLTVTTIDIYQPEKARVKIDDSRELLTKAI